MIDTPVLSPSDSDAQAVLAPVVPAQRIEAIDIMRGIAILGIFLVNMLSYAGFRQSYEQMTLVDQSSTVLIRFTAQAKFYPLFSLLFGWGMALQMQRAASRGISFVPFWIRRMLVLLLIGLIHAVLIWHGDILVTYALLGIPLVFVRKVSDRALLVLVILCMLVPILISMPGPGEEFRSAYGRLAAPAREAVAASEQANPLSVATYGQAVEQRLYQLRFTYVNVLYWGTHVFGMMVIGLMVGRREIFRHFQQHRDLLRRVFWLALGVGLILNAAWVWASVAPDQVPSGWYDVATRGVRTIGGPALTIAYLTGVVWLANQAAWRQQFGGLAAVGRMALTNYLTQSVLCTWLFYGYGLGIYGELGPFLTLVLTLVIFRLQMWLSEWWLARYRFGPVEWVWRSLTYGKRQPWRHG